MDPAPNSYHQEIVWNLSQVLGSYLREHPIGRVYLRAAYDVYLSEHDVVQPDLLFLTGARQNLRQEDGLHGAPDLVIEVLSVNGRDWTRNGSARFTLTRSPGNVARDPVLQQIHRYKPARNQTKAVVTKIIKGTTDLPPHSFRA